MLSKSSRADNNFDDNPSEGHKHHSCGVPKEPLNALGTDAIQEQERGACVPEIVGADVGEDAFRFLTSRGCLRRGSGW
jgi:hypothetical protein